MKKKVEKSPKISILLTELDKKVNPKLVYYFSFLIRSGDIIFFNNKDAEKYDFTSVLENISKIFVT